MALIRQIAGLPGLNLEHALLDLNGTTTSWGEMEESVRERLALLAEQIEVHLLSADTYGTLANVAASLGISHRVVENGTDKRAAVLDLGPDRCVAIGNGANDAEMLASARLGIAVLGGEGLSAAALREADVFCGSMVEALDLLLEESGLSATLRP